MENIKLSPGTLVGKTSAVQDLASNTGSIEGERKKKIAKDFEGVLLNKVMDEMKESIPDSGLLEDETSKQTQGLFWMYLAQDVAAKGGFGLWKQIYAQMNETGNRCAPTNSMDAKI
jgi:Rod binding domain-containing protein